MFHCELRWAGEQTDNVEKEGRFRGRTRTRLLPAGSSLGGRVAVGPALKLQDGNLGARVRGVLALCLALLHPDSVPAGVPEPDPAQARPMQDGRNMVRFFKPRGSTHSGLSRRPPVYQAVCGAHPLRDDGHILGEVLDQAGYVALRFPIPLVTIHARPVLWWLNAC